VFFVFTAVLAEDIVVCMGCVDTFGLVVLTIWIPGSRIRARGIEWVVLLYRWVCVELVVYCC
jgi:hypothetical protein